MKHTGNSGMSAVPNKQFFKIGEVAKIVGVKAHTLRYWEREFPALRPKKTRGAHRHYSRHDVELAMQIRQLIQDRGHTVSGAKQALRESRQHLRSSTMTPHARREVALRAELLALRRSLADLLQTMDKKTYHTIPEEPAHVKVHQVVPAAANIRTRTKP